MVLPIENICCFVKPHQMITRCSVKSRTYLDITDINLFLSKVSNKISSSFVLVWLLVDLYILNYFRSADVDGTESRAQALLKY